LVYFRIFFKAALTTPRDVCTGWYDERHFKCSCHGLDRDLPYYSAAR